MISPKQAGIVYFVLLFFLANNAIGAEQKYIVLMETMPVNSVLESSRWFKVQLKDMGYIEGDNLKLTVLTPKGDRNKAEQLLKSALKEKTPDLVVTNATLASQVAVKVLKDTNIPLIFFTVGAPVKAGLVQEIDKPTGTNVTGLVKMLPSKTQLNIVSRLLKQKGKKAPVRFGYIYPTYPSSEGDLKKLMKESNNFNQIKLIPYKIQYRKVPVGLPEMINDTISGIASLKGSVDYWWESAGPLGESPEYTKSLQEHSSIPIIWGHRMDSVKMGALVSVVVSLEANGRETAMIADAILKGTHPGTIAVSTPSSFLIGVNLTTAKKLNLIVPPDILDLARGHLYR